MSMQQELAFQMTFHGQSSDLATGKDRFAIRARKNWVVGLFAIRQGGAFFK
jgi:hypothetical protein